MGYVQPHPVDAAIVPHWIISPPSHVGKAMYPIVPSEIAKPARSFFGVTAVASSAPAFACACVATFSVPMLVSDAFSALNHAVFATAWLLSPRSGVGAVEPAYSARGPPIASPDFCTAFATLKVENT
jgi:hypothetical protein